MSANTPAKFINEPLLAKCDRRQFVTAALVLAMSLALAAMIPGDSLRAQARQSNPAVGPSNRPLPRFASLKITPANLRIGPGLNYRIEWVLRQPGMPLEILREFDNWRQVRDAESTVGWVHHAFLSGRRTAAVEPWAINGAVNAAVDGAANAAAGRPITNLHERASASSSVVARLEAGTVVDVETCDGTWCKVWIESYSGYLRQDKLWGVYKDEEVG